MYMIIYKQAYVTNLTAKFANMNRLLKFIFIITPMGSQKNTPDIGQNLHFKPLLEKNLFFQSISLKKVHDILQYCRKELFKGA